MVCIQERDVTRVGEFFAELVDVDCFVIVLDLGKFKLLAGNESLYLIVIGKLDAGAVHPGFVLIDQSQSLPGIVYQLIQNSILEYEVGLEEKSIVLTELLLSQGQGVNIVRLIVDGILNEDYGGLYVKCGDIIDQLAALIAYYNDDPGQAVSIDLMKHPVDERHSVYFDHAFSVVLGELF